MHGMYSRRDSGKEGSDDNTHQYQDTDTTNNICQNRKSTGL